MRPVGALLATLASLLLLPSCFEEYESRYASLADARESSEAGWIPPYLPASARDIRERHDVESNEIWISFRYDPEDPTWMGDACQPTDEVPGPHSSPGWWPEPLTGTVRTGPDLALWICARTIPIGGSPRPHLGALAVERSSSTAWYWEPHR